MIDNELAIPEDQPIDDDDVFAGNMLGWMLSLFFAYTIFTSFYVIWWTWDSIQAGPF
ncbi:hypothetical protein [uncultured Rubinisphaera sp.]|uniref:hypothetical protein n=1 Tax=uncultured Rubinisphaera sp. TaxID=1678686 RepID=UPI0026B98ADA|tara:strand:+ start:455 stop:625 length:171 start_codon:yes stop_codon:yes gene_type:complete